VQSHAGILYQPFRLNRPYQDPSMVDSFGRPEERTTKRGDAFGGTVRTEFHPSSVIDLAGLGYTYLAPVAGNKHQVDADLSRAFGNWTLSGAYIFRQPVVGPVPFLQEGTAANPGAVIATPRGPDDPFWVQWDNRKAHMGSLTLVYDPTPGTPFFKYQPNVLDDWNLNPDEDALFSGALQYRVVDYLTDTDRLYYWDEDRNLHYDFATHTGALASAHPLSSFAGLARIKLNGWRVTTDIAAGEALAGLAQAYTSATDFFKPSTIFISGGVAVDNGTVKTFVRYGQDVWGPYDYQAQLGWTYHKIYQAGISYIFLKDFETGFRYIATRMTDQFIGSDMGAFNEYNFFLTYHFGLERNMGSKIQSLGHALPQVIPEAAVSVSDSKFTPDGTGPTRYVLISARAGADAGVLSWTVAVRNAQGETVRKWDGNGATPRELRWDGLAPDAKPLPTGSYRVTFSLVDLYGNEATSPAQVVEIESLTPSQSVTPVTPNEKSYTVTATPEGLKVTLSSLILFDVDKDQLKDSAKSGLDQVVELLHAYPTNVLRVSGHSDATGGDRYNQELSERRAKAVAAYLVEKGIAKSRITAIGYGKRRPVASNKTEEGRQQNRRVEIDILK
jgi:outer membrane protein OmpA-like peptidoglycan-associated protein